MDGTLQIGIKKEKQRLEQLQFLRFLAFFCVYVAHAEEWLFFPFPSANCSTSAVGFFFVLSGFLAGYSASGKEIRLGLREYGKNLWKRILRLYPLYALTMLIPLIYSDILLYVAAAEFDGSLLQLLKNLLMIQSWFSEGSMSFNGVGWYISTLMFLYLFTLPVTALLSRINRHPKRLVLFTGFILSVLFAVAVYCYLTKSWDLGYWHYVFPPARLGEYVSGIGLGYLVSAVRLKVRLGAWEKWLFTFLEAGALLLSFRSMYVFGSPWRVHILNWLIPNFILITVFALGRGYLSRLFRMRPLVRLGDISFECFLVHGLLLTGLSASCGKLADTYTGKIIGFLVALLLSIVISLYLNKSGKAPRK